MMLMCVLDMNRSVLQFLKKDVVNKHGQSPRGIAIVLHTSDVTQDVASGLKGHYLQSQLFFLFLSPLHVTDPQMPLELMRHLF